MKNLDRNLISEARFLHNKTHIRYIIENPRNAMEKINVTLLSKHVYNSTMIHNTLQIDMKRTQLIFHIFYSLSCWTVYGLSACSYQKWDLLRHRKVGFLFFFESTF